MNDTRATMTFKTASSNKKRRSGKSQQTQRLNSREKRINQIVAGQTVPEGMAIFSPNPNREPYPKRIKYERSKSFNMCDLDRRNLKDYLKQRQSGDKKMSSFACE